MSKPDFLCVGLQKAGTGTLWKFLSRDDRFWMPKIKELSHFNKDSLKQRKIHKAEKIYGKFGGVNRIGLAFRNLKLRAKGRRLIEPADVEFLENYKRYLHNKRSDEDYQKLFSGTPSGRLTGDITPNYSGMGDAKIERAKNLLPHAHIILMLRNPVERLWSAYNMRLRHDIRDGSTNADDQFDLDKINQASETEMGLEDYINRPGVMRRSFPSGVYKNWSRVFGAERVHVVLFEDFIHNQQQTVDELYQCLRTGESGNSAASDASTDRASATIPIYPRRVIQDKARAATQKAEHKNRGVKLELSADDRRLLEEFMADEIEASIDLFGDRMTCWRFD